MKVACWGCGDYAKAKMGDILKQGLEIYAYIDSWKNGDVFLGYPVYDAKNAYEISQLVDFILILSNKYADEIFCQCLRIGIAEEQIRIFKGKFMVPFHDLYGNETYSQDGEEMYLCQRFQEKETGFYVDVGAYHPYRFSNTYWAYRKGWSGINIEPDRAKFELFTIMRPRDINLNCGIWNYNGELDYYIFRETALSTFVREDAEMMRDNYNNELLEKVKVECKCLKDIFEHYNINKIDFMDIDVEGAELHVLESIDFSKVSIECIMLEQLQALDVPSCLQSKEYKILVNEGYEVTAIYNRTVFYEKSDMLSSRLIR